MHRLERTPILNHFVYSWGAISLVRCQRLPRQQLQTGVAWEAHEGQRSISNLVPSAARSPTYLINKSIYPLSACLAKMNMLVNIVLLLVALFNVTMARPSSLQDSSLMEGERTFEITARDNLDGKVCQLHFLLVEYKLSNPPERNVTIVNMRIDSALGYRRTGFTYAQCPPHMAVERVAPTSICRNRGKGPIRQEVVVIPPEGLVIWNIFGEASGVRESSLSMLVKSYGWPP